MTQTDVNSTVKYVLDRTVKPGYNYIFYSLIGPREIHVYKGQADICADYIPISEFSLSLSCNRTIYSQPMIGMSA